MPKFLIEREWPDAGRLSAEAVKKIAQQSCDILSGMKTPIYWINSYVTDNKLYCIYVAPDVDTLLEHASFSGFAANKITAVKQIIDPETAE